MTRAQELIEFWNKLKMNLVINKMAEKPGVKDGSVGINYLSNIESFDLIIRRKNSKSGRVWIGYHPYIFGRYCSASARCAG